METNMEIPAHYDEQTGKLTLDLACMPDALELLYNEKQVAEMFGVTVDSVRYWRRTRVIPHIVVNRTVRFTKAQLDEFVKRNSVAQVREFVSRKEAAS